MATDNGPTFVELGIGIAFVMLIGGLVEVFKNPQYIDVRNALVSAFVAVVTCVMILVFAMFFPAKSKS